MAEDDQQEDENQKDVLRKAEIARRADHMRKNYVNQRPNPKTGKPLTIGELQDGYKAIFDEDTEPRDNDKG
jgi:hypothetical protein